MRELRSSSLQVTDLAIILTTTLEETLSQNYPATASGLLSLKTCEIIFVVFSLGVICCASVDLVNECSRNVRYYYSFTFSSCESSFEAQEHIHLLIGVP